MQNTSSYRKPVIYVKLPSEGKWWAPGSLELEGDGTEVGIRPMTVRDEMMLRTPDALMNGEAVINILKSCCPAIKDPWQCPSMDMDTLLLGIRIATYGAEMTITSTVPVANEVYTWTFDCSRGLELINQNSFQSDHQLSDGTVIHIRPLNYKITTNLNIKNYEQAKLADNIQKSTNNESQKLEEIQKAFMNITNLTIKNIADQITKVTHPDYELTSSQDIYNWVLDIPAPVANEIKTKIQSQKSIGTLPPIEIATPDELIKKGAPGTFKQTITLDFSNFFA